jgi:hypothetical protein
MEQFRFTITHEIEGSVVMSDPGGWDTAALGFERHSTFYSLVEYYKSQFTSYGSNGSQDGRRDWIKMIERDYGPDAIISVLAEYSTNDQPYEILYEGTIPIGSISESLDLDHTLDIPFAQKLLWTKFVSRYETPVDVQSPKSLDDTDVDVIAPIDLPLPSQQVNQVTTYKGHTGETESVIDCDVATFEDVVLSGIQIIDQVLGYEGRRVLVKSNVDETENGIYTESSGAWSRAADANTTNELDGCIVKILLGSLNAGKTFKQQTATPTIGVDNIVWEEYNYVDDFLLIENYDVVGVNNFADRLIFYTGGTAPRGDQEEIDKSYEIPFIGAPALESIVEIIEIINNERGVLNLQGSIDFAFGFAGLYSGGSPITANNWDIKLKLQVNEDTPYTIDNFINNMAGPPFEYPIYFHTDLDFTPFDENFNAIIINPGDRVRLYMEYELSTAGNPGDSWTERKVYGGIVDQDIRFTFFSTFNDTVASGFLIHDLGRSIIDRITGVNNSLYSEVLGGRRTSPEYDYPGCYYLFMLFQGLQLRGYSLIEKILSQSMKDFWEGSNPLLNLGLGYETFPKITLVHQPSTVQDLADWIKAGGPYPGVNWNLASYGYPWTSVNGNGGIDGYIVGEVATIAGGSYRFSFLFEIGSASAISKITVALLDALFNETVTYEFEYDSAGFKFETIDLNPFVDGMYVGVRIQNDTPFATKNYWVRYVIGGDASQLLENDEFYDASSWTNEGAGIDWVLGGGASISLASGSSKQLTQEIGSSGPGKYLLVSERIVSGINFGVDSLNLGYSFYDESDVLITSTIDFASVDGTQAIGFEFNASSRVAKVVVTAEVNSGSDIDVEIPYVRLYGPLVEVAVTVIPERTAIVIKNKREFFDDSEMTVLLSNVRKISRDYDHDHIANAVQIGHSKWQGWDISGIDDPQTERTFANTFRNIGKKFKLLSNWIGASLTIEQARRTTRVKSADYRYDNEVFIIGVKDDTDTGIQVDLGDGFSDVSGLQNEATRYNKRLTATRTFLRWLDYFNGALQFYLTSAWKFVGGQGNYDMTSTMQVNGCDDAYGGNPLTENQNIQVENNHIFTPQAFKIEHYLTWDQYKAIRAQRHKAIGISQTTENHKPFFIKDLEWMISDRTVSIVAWPKDPFEIETPEDISDGTGRIGGGIFDTTFDDTFE